MKFDYYHLGAQLNFQQINEIVEKLHADANPNLTDNMAPTVKTADTKLIEWGKAKHYLHNLEQIVKHVNQVAFGFSLYDYTDFDTVNLNEYSESNSGEYKWHNDFPLGNVEENKLTVIVNLSTEYYEGGTLELFQMGPSRVFEIETPGSIVVFPSWIYHRVTPVTKGNRRTLSMWISGPSFR
jgi:PKHD-type hydroxylase